ncbi:MAG TPA: zinc-dependent peptidase [Polyangiaceae bacterium LLY-WYZ-15_(1-7)]|nr:hypothetical protein [Sandaracinus sp.]HJL05815.1 zinc-dependent peptidase [Polyangiaceae bacterium LLY-WYZ-15_(1-7)]MBJ73731.1 hypothetical protein [Sandaracinus sp.]HJL13905.1 zinc-dependent peptidase [Polyangiaceae bacterium LLY-WYZ-15_(1-7)]HJL22169.1 zinc-dependent peptidase [Polyangiaceae bacterium LLY-WYZ-15_(1-7)]
MTAADRRRLVFHLVVGGGVSGGLIALGLARGATWAVIAGALVAAIWVAVAVQRPLRRRRALAGPFPEGWRRVLEERVRFYRLLDEAGRARFERNMQILAADYPIEAVQGAEIDDVVRVLALAGAAVLLQGLEGWEMPARRSILVYPDAFDEGYDLGPHARTAGQVHRQGPIIFSARSLRRGWKAETDGHNVSIHEWAHVLDLADGFADGVPVDAQGEWESLVKDELQRVRRGRSKLDDYAGTNQAELFAVAVETFFERPRQLKRKHPALYEALARYFRADPAA